MKDDGANLRVILNTVWVDNNGNEHNQSFLTVNGGQKGLRSILTERGLWPNRQTVYRQCICCKNKRPHDQRVTVDGYAADHWIAGEQCCAVYILSQQPDFLAQKEWLTETVESYDNCEIIFFPKFHCELNFIELVWAFMKAFLRKRCENHYAQMKEMVPPLMDLWMDIGLVYRVLN